MSKKIIVSIIGATGYTGLELVRLLVAHPHAEFKYLTSATHVDTPYSEVWPHLKNVVDLPLSNPDPATVAEESDLVFLSLPHFESSKVAPQLIGKTKVIDLSGDFRLKDVELFEQYYGQAHSFPEGLKSFVYGFPELNAELIKTAHYVANPGCFATACQLALLPFKGKISKVDIVAITGSSGSGKSATDGTHHPVRSHNVKSYKIGTHQHLPEIVQYLELPLKSFSFVPTSGPFARGIQATAFLTLDSPMSSFEMDALIQSTYASAPFVRVQSDVQLADVVGSNYADIACHSVNGQPVVQVVIDNLVKGAAGTAVHNMNLMFGLDETAGLAQLSPLFP